MNMTSRGIGLIKKYEGLRLNAYQDSVGVWTIGFGSTLGVKEGDRISPEQAETLLKADLQRFENGVAAALSGPCKQSQFEAMVSLAFNVGLANFKGSTLLKLHNGNQPFQTAQQFQKWCNAGGKPLLGLLRRRLSEALLYLEDL